MLINRATPLPETSPPEDAVIAACVAIYRRWLRFRPHQEALEQATQFAKRFGALS